MRKWIAALAMTLSIACVRPTPPIVVPPPDPPDPPPTVTVGLDANAQDRDTGRLVFHATLRITDGPNAGRQDSTGERGYVTWLGLTPGPVTVCGDLDGYAESCQSFTLVADRLGADGLFLQMLAEPPPIPDWTYEQLRAWRGVITMPCDGLPAYGLSPPRLFTAQGFDTAYTAGERARAIECFKSEGYTHWPLGPILQQGYHGQWPSSDFRADTGPFLERVAELNRAGIITPIYLLDDICVWACEHGGLNWEAIERELTPIYSRPEWQRAARIVVAGWEPRWSSDDWRRASEWMARVFPNAYRTIHFPSGMGAPGRHEDFLLKDADGNIIETPEEGFARLGYKAHPDEASMWNQVIPHIHAFLLQESYVFTGDQVDAGRTPEQQYEYDLYDKVRRFTYGSSGSCRAALAAGEIPIRTLNRWDETRGTDGKDYCQFDGQYSTTSAAGVRLDVVSYEYQSYRQKTQGAEWYEVGKRWGAIALTVPGVTGFGDGGPGR